MTKQKHTNGIPDSRSDSKIIYGKVNANTVIELPKEQPTIREVKFDATDQEKNPEWYKPEMDETQIRKNRIRFEKQINSEQDNNRIKTNIKFLSSPKQPTETEEEDTERQREFFESKVEMAPIYSVETKDKTINVIDVEDEFKEGDKFDWHDEETQQEYKIKIDKNKDLNIRRKLCKKDLNFDERKQLGYSYIRNLELENYQREKFPLYSERAPYLIIRKNNTWKVPIHHSEKYREPLELEEQKRQEIRKNRRFKPETKE